MCQRPLLVVYSEPVSPLMHPDESLLKLAYFVRHRILVVYSGFAAGVLFMDNAGYEPACGHATTGTITCLLAAGIVEAVEPETHLALDTAAGLVRATATVRDGEAESVTFENVPAFVFRRDVDVAVPAMGDLVVDVGLWWQLFRRGRRERQRPRPRPGTPDRPAAWPTWACASWPR
ncbi:MAG: proline racemase family protein [Anaerolineae bacterium]